MRCSAIHRPEIKRYLEQKKAYEHLLVQMQKNIEKQKAAVSKMAQVDLPEVVGFEMLEGQMKLQKLNKEIVDAFVAESIASNLSGN